MRPRRTAIVPNMIWGTAIASIIPSQLVACGGSASESGSAGSTQAGAGDHAGSAGHSGQSGAAGNPPQGYAGYIVLAIGAFGGAGAGFGAASGAGAGGSEVMMAGSGG